MDIASELKVMVVEDDPDLLDIMGEIVLRHFPNILKLSDGTHAYEQFNDFQPDFIVCDIQMAVMSGIEFISKIRADGHSTPVILCSGDPSRADLKRALTLGVVDFIEKPFNVQSVESSIFRMLEVRSRSEQLNELIEKYGESSEQVRKQRRIIALYQALNAKRTFKP